MVGSQIDIQLEEEIEQLVKKHDNRRGLQILVGLEKLINEAKSSGTVDEIKKLPIVELIDTLANNLHHTNKEIGAVIGMPAKFIKHLRLNPLDLALDTQEYPRQKVRVHQTEGTEITSYLSLRELQGILKFFHVGLYSEYLVELGEEKPRVGENFDPNHVVLHADDITVGGSTASTHVSSADFATALGAPSGTEKLGDANNSMKLKVLKRQGAALTAKCVVELCDVQLIELRKQRLNSDEANDLVELLENVRLFALEVAPVPEPNDLVEDEMRLKKIWSDFCKMMEKHDPNFIAKCSKVGAISVFVGMFALMGFPAAVAGPTLMTVFFGKDAAKGTKELIKTMKD